MYSDEEGEECARSLFSEVDEEDEDENEAVSVLEGKRLRMRLPEEVAEELWAEAP